MAQFEKMNPVVKEIWVKALEDPDAKQITGTLRTNEGMCCLGVLTECGIAAGVSVTRTYDEVDDCYEYSWEGDEDPDDPVHTSDGSLPYPIMKWAGLGTCDPVITVEVDNAGYEDGIEASVCNDSKGYSFQQIADLIKENL